MRVYASYVPILLTVILGAFLYRRNRGPGAWGEGLGAGGTLGAWGSGLGAWVRPTAHDPRSTAHDLRPTIYGPRSTIRLLILAAVLFLIVILATTSWTATLIWLSSVLILFGFVFVLLLKRVPWSSIAAWTVASVLPHAVLGVQQYFLQDLTGSVLLGIATHHPWTSGTSVVEHGLYRVLRAYGGFPHPNILGGWLAMSLALLPSLVREARTKYGALLTVFSGALITAALLFSYSRGAWLAAAFGFGLAVIFELRSARGAADRQSLWLLCIAVLVVGIGGAVSQWDHVQTRLVASERLEQWSMEQRTTSLRDGIQAWMKRPVIGWGPGAGLLGIISLRVGEPSTVAPEPPHMLPFVLLLETGLAGLAAFFCLLFALWPAIVHRMDWKRTGPLLSLFTVLALTDHYLWTLWPGMALSGLILVQLAVRRR